MPDEERGQIVKAFVVLSGSSRDDAALMKELQDFVKHTIAPYKYPRAVEFLDALPRTETGKLQRFRLRERSHDGEKALLPPGWPRPRGYANGVGARGRIVFVAGHDRLGRAAASSSSDDLAEQARQALANVVAVLAEGGARPSTSCA